MLQRKFSCLACWTCWASWVCYDFCGLRGCISWNFFVACEIALKMNVFKRQKKRLLVLKFVRQMTWLNSCWKCQLFLRHIMFKIDYLCWLFIFLFFSLFCSYDVRTKFSFCPTHPSIYHEIPWNCISLFNLIHSVRFCAWTSRIQVPLLFLFVLIFQCEVTWLWYHIVCPRTILLKFYSLLQGLVSQFVA